MSDPNPSAGKGPEDEPGLPVPTLSTARRLLVPIDFSELSVHAIPWAYALAGSGGSVVLVHVVDPVGPPNPLYAHYRPGHAQSDEERSRSHDALCKRLLALAPASATRDGISTEVEAVEDSKVAEGLREVAERLRIDAICIASHCRGPVGRTILGSVAEALLRTADRPLFIVPHRRD
jgi:nucleotide-binding universal stress UspA family protein